jgi:hypothetical protein
MPGAPAVAMQQKARLVFELEDGKIKRFDCYPEGSVIFAQLGVLNNSTPLCVTEKVGVGLNQ